MGRSRRWMILAVTASLGVPPLGAQEAQGVLNLFFDCQGTGCWDLDFFRREIPVVNWVRDREVSDLHVLVTSQTTGGGGRFYTLSFIGRRGFEGENQELTVGTAGDAATDEQRQAIAQRLKMGLVRYLAGTAAADEIVVSLRGTEGEDAPGAPGAPGDPDRGQAAAPQDDPGTSGCSGSAATPS